MSRLVQSAALSAALAASSAIVSPAAALASQQRPLFARNLAAPHIGHLSVYANDLSAILPDLYAALDLVSRELVGFIPSVSRNSTAERAALNQTVQWPIVDSPNAIDVVPAMQVPEPPDITPTNSFMALTKMRAVPFGFTGEEQRGLNTGPGYLTIQGQVFAEALRKLVNEIEADVAVEAAANASRAYGTPGTTPFGTEKLTDTAQLQKILDDNGASPVRSLVIDTSAAANLITMYNLTRANEAGTTLTLRQGELLDIHGLSIKKSAQVVRHVAGTGASATTNAAGYAVGATVITLANAGTGTVKPGDVITFAGDANKYVVAVGDTDVSNGGTITLSKPGLRVAIPAAATAITVSGNHTANVAFAQGAIQLATRPPARPVEGDMRIDSLTITDIRSGLSFEVSVWPGYRKVRLEVAMVWGVKAVKREHIVKLMG